MPSTSIIFVIIFASLFIITNCTWIRQEQESSQLNSNQFKKAITTIAISMKQTDIQKLTLNELFYNISDPSHESYGKFLSKYEVAERFGATEEDLSAVVNWISSFHPSISSFISISEHRDVILLSDIPVSLTSQIFGAKFQRFQNTETQKSIFRALSYSCPTHIASKILFIDGLSSLPPSRSIKAASSNFPGINITPDVIFSSYGIPKNQGGNKGNLAIAEFSGDLYGQYFSDSDLSTFEKLYDLNVESVSEVVGKNDVKQPTGEAELDVQYGKAIVGKVPVIFWEHSGTYLEWITSVSNRNDTPLVWSVSYNLGDELEYSSANREAIDTAFQKLALRGVSFLFASGDEGTGRTGTILCGTFNPGYPAASPYVTSVGGTYKTSSDGVELGWGDSGGGFSFAYPRPSYQEKQVTDYLAQQQAKLPNAKFFNKNGRGFPDVSALATNYQIIVTNTTFSITGTSASTPVVAALVSILNNNRLEKGLSPLGFLNPLLYSLNQDAFFDITSGNNKQSGCSGGFNADKGWDSLSGLGSINFVKMNEYSLAAAKLNNK